MSRRGLARGTERVEIADVRLVLEREHLRYPLELECRRVPDERLRPPGGEPAELEQAAVHDPAPAERERVDERAADPERLALRVVERPVELLVPDEHVAVHLVARAAA